ncbi:ERF family protein, partial [Enterococcus faecalis]
MSEDKKTFVEKLIAVQTALKAPKGQYNSFGKYKYRSAEDILNAVKPLNAEQGLLLTLSDEPLLIGDWHYIKATATITDGIIKESFTAYARESL